MYYDNRFEQQGPPVASSSRRPWSPDPHDPYPSTRGAPQGVHYDYYEGAAQSSRNGQGYRRGREPSDQSVEALDLADYSYALQTGRRDPHGPKVPPPPRAFQAYDSYPPSPRGPIRPLATGNTIDSVPSMTTGPSSATHHTSSSARTPSRRPFSLPAVAPSRSYPGHWETPERYPYHYDGEVGFSGSSKQHLPREEQDTEVDIGQFPPWSRHWYAAKGPAASSRGSLPASQRPMKKDVFDPSYPTHLHDENELSPYATYAPQDDPYAPNPYPSVKSYSARSDDVLPWGNSASRLQPPVDEAQKEERMRMLEAEFGGTHDAGARHGKDDDTEPLIGGVDEKGRLVTHGPKKRWFTRFLQGALALAAAITSIYAALMIKTPTPPPPKGTPQSYLLYVLSVITTLVVIYLFLIRPCCIGPRKNKNGPGAQMPGGMMVLPVQHMPGGAKAGKKGKKGKKGAKGGGGDVQVNLIVDPTMFGGGRGREEEEDDEDDDSTERNWAASSAGKGKRKPKRRSVFAALAMEAQWKTARSSLRKIMAFDMLAALVWSAAFIYIVTGKHCPANGFNGWCTAYNTAMAASCLLAFAFGLSIFFDIKDLYASRQSPRTRT